MVEKRRKGRGRTFLRWVKVFKNIIKNRHRKNYTNKGGRKECREGGKKEEGKKGGRKERWREK